jgi:hypothetical protein
MLIPIERKFMNKATLKRKTYIVVFIVGAIALSASSALAATACPSGGTPPPGSKVTGGLTVDGVCILVNVKVTGGLTVSATGALSLQASTVGGGIVVVPGGELDLNATTSGTGVPTGTSSTVNGGIAASNAFDYDFWTATINGGIAVEGPSSLSFPFFCGNHVNGSSSFSNFDNAVTIGGGVGGGGVPCGGNIFNGSVSLTNVKANMGGDTIMGDLLCTNSTVTVTAPNTVTGKNTCF